MARALLALFLTGFCAAVAAGEDVYKWVDEQGRLHFGSRPPKGAKVQKMAPHATEPAAAPAATWQQQLGQSNLRRLQKRQEDAQEAKEQQRSTQRCLAARRALDLLNRERPIYHVDNQGEREYMSDEQRQAAIARANQGVATHCR